MEYLDEKYNLVHHKTDIEVPEGAECAILGSEGSIYFWRSNFFIGGKYTDWFDMKDGYDANWYLKESAGARKVWQRTPSVDVVDNINHPTHYTSGAVECIEAIEASMSAEAFKGFLKGNIIKYMWRYEQKGGAESLEKAQWYLNLLLSRVSS